jgi:hypothetical protein
VDLSNHGLPNGKVTLADLSKFGARFAVSAIASKNIAIAVGSHGIS